MKLCAEEVEFRTWLDTCEFPISRDDCVSMYAELISLYDEIKDWGSVNQAIINKWSLSGLKYIKREAWKHIVCE